MEHHFNIDIAQKYGVNEAIFLSNIVHWLLHNKANDKHFHANRYWTYNTARAFLVLFPYWSAKNLRTTIDSCIAQGILIKGNFNARKNDRTLWYSLSDDGLKLFPAIGKVDLTLVKDEDHLSETANETGRGFQGIENEKTPVAPHLPESAHPFAGIGTALPYIKPDRKQKIKDMGEKPKKKIKKTPTTLPEDFMYTSKHQELAASLGLDINFHFQDFKDKAVMKGTEWICWNAAFMNWLRKAPQFVKPQLSVVSNNSNNQASYPRKEIKSTVPWFNNNH